MRHRRFDAKKVADYLCRNTNARKDRCRCRAEDPWDWIILFAGGDDAVHKEIRTRPEGWSGDAPDLARLSKRWLDASLLLYPEAERLAILQAVEYCRACRRTKPKPARNGNEAKLLHRLHCRARRQAAADRTLELTKVVRVKSEHKR